MRSIALISRGLAATATLLVLVLQGCTTPVYYPPRPGSQTPPVIGQETGVPVEERMPVPPVTRPSVPAPVQPPVNTATSGGRRPARYGRATGECR